MASLHMPWNWCPFTCWVVNNLSEKAYALTSKQSKQAFLKVQVHYYGRCCSTFSLMTWISVYLMSHWGCTLMTPTAYLSDVSLTILENKDLRTLSSWFESNHLTVNSTKTQALSVWPYDYDYLFLNNTRMEFFKFIKTVGVTLGRDLSYKERK